MSGTVGPELRIELLGGFRVLAGALAVPEAAWRLRKARGLVKLLALAPGRRLHRDEVVEALWPSRDGAATANHLRQVVFSARRAVDCCGVSGAGVITLAHDVLALESDGLEVDVELFEAAAERAEGEASRHAYAHALSLYAGELLVEDRFEPWAAARREALRERHLGLLLGLARVQAQQGDADAAIATLQAGLLREPLDERAHRELMRLFALSGRRQRALAQFHLLRDRLRREFEDEPEPSTRMLYREILARRAGTEAMDTSKPEPRRAPVARPVGNLPLPLTSFVGRERALGEVLGLLRRHRLVTLTGPGGCGKTRLALEAGRALSGEYSDGVWLAELAGVPDGALVPQAVAEALGVQSRSARPAQEGVVVHVGARELLLVLDNCEHLIEACAPFVLRLLEECPCLRVLVTSREPLHIGGEVTWRVPSLAPAEAERLFVERATVASSRFRPVPAVAEICRRLDGIPLAIELAAARVAVLAPAQIAERLRDSLAVLAGGQRTALTRQQTLAATLDWSHALLAEDERRLFRRLGAFAAGFGLEAVEGVCEGDLDVLGRLIDKSLVTVEEYDGIARYGLLETVRHYARERLAEAAERDSLQARHRRHYLDLARRLEPDLHDPARRRELALDGDELRWALRTGVAAEPECALELAACIWRLWHDRGELAEGVRWLEEALRAAPDPSPARARVLHGLSVLSLRTSDHARAVETAVQATEYWRASGQRVQLSEELHHLGAIHWVFAGHEAAGALCTESRELASALEAPALVASVTHTLGVIAGSRSDHMAARELIELSIELLRELPDDGSRLFFPVALGYGRLLRTTPGPSRRFLEQTFVTGRRVGVAQAIACSLTDLAAAARYAGELEDARALLAEAHARFRALGDPLGCAQALAQLGNLHAALGEPERAWPALEESLAIREAAGDARGIGLSLIGISAAAAGFGDAGRAQQAAERALELFERTDDGPGRASAVLQLGYLACDARRPQAARDLLEEALEHWRGFIPDTLWCAPILLELAELDDGAGEHERAAQRRREARHVCERNGDRELLAECERAMDARATW